MADYHEFPAAPEGTPVSNFVHLHVHSDYSLLDSCATIDKLVAKAKALNMPALALTDHGNMFGALNFEKLCHVNGINPIVGEEFYVAYGSHLEKNDVPYSHKGEEGDRHAHYFHLVLLCENQKGYENMCWLSSIAYTEGLYYGKPRIDFELLEKYHEGLICCSACIQGELPQLLMAGMEEEAKELALKYKNLFGPDHYYIEIQDHGLPDQKIACEKLVKLARKYNKNVLFHSDGVQAFMKFPYSLMDLDVDYYTISAHKIYGPKGVGALFVKQGKRVNPYIFGGGQENGLRSGTENVFGIVAFSRCVEKISKELERNYNLVSDKRNGLLTELQKQGIDYRVYGDGVPHILSICLNNNVRGETLVHALEKRGVYISTGSACSSTKHMNRTLEEMGINKNEILCANRISFSPYENFDEKNLAVIINDELKKLKEKKYE